MIKIYFANIALLNNAKQFESWMQRMHPIRKGKIEKCRQQQDKERSLLAGILLKFALEQEGLVYEDTDFEITEHGKPVIKNVMDLHFSISHAGNYAICCMSDSLVGADIEVVEKRIFEDEERLSKTAQKVLAESEFMKFSNSDFETKKKLFLKYWTCKESYSKALGKGLTMDFNQIDIENCGGKFWSKWLQDDCFVSVYTEEANCNDLTVQQLTSLEF